MKGQALSRPAELNLLSKGTRIWIMGVLNATPDSFYPDSRIATVEDAQTRAAQLVNEGADVIDVGGESTRPGASPVDVDLELARVLPVLERLHAQWPSQYLSIDTRKAEVARRALACGVRMINDVSALRQDPEMAAVAAESRCAVVLMHMQGTPSTMQLNPRYDNVLADLQSFFEERMGYAVRQGIAEENIILDPGIGFGKSLEHNLTILKRLKELTRLGRPLLIGASRKSFIHQIGSENGAPLPPGMRLEGSLAAALWVVQQGACGLRAHDVAETRRALRVWGALAG